MFLLNTALFLYTRRVVHIWYAVYMIAFSLFSATQDGWSQLYVYPIVSVSNDYLYALLSLVALAAQSIYYMQFMQVKDRTPLLYKVHSSLIVLRVLFFLFSWFFFQEGLTLIVFDTFLLLPACVSSVYLWVKGVEEVRLIAIGYIVFFMGFLIHSLESIHWIPNSMFTVYASQLGVIVEMFCQILAFGDQWRIERNARLAAKQEVIVSLQANQELQQQLIQELQEKEWISQRVNRELNDKVAERTIEIQKINSALDKIVYDKDKLILSERWNRIFHVITESTFDQLFRKEEECYLFLDRLKNEESQYRCNSCDSSDTAIDWSQHARICNTCGHKALIKQHTIFQGSKIPLDKAFKILFFTVHQSPYSYEQLSIKLDLRKATVHAFKQKITDHITTLGKSYTLKELFILSVATP
ncbi:MAG: 7TM-DISM domain-containing protein [Cytophagaceae bacterium]|nr:7TM-DISM domain-containing protein [Cytophagaceae bacterium]